MDPDEGEFDWSQARVVMPPSKQAISVRIDRDVLDFFKAQGRRLPDQHQCGPAQLHGSEARADSVEVNSLGASSKASTERNRRSLPGGVLW